MATASITWPAGQQGVDVLQSLIDSCAQPPDRLVVAGVAVHSGLPRPDKAVYCFCSARTSWLSACRSW